MFITISGHVSQSLCTIPGFPASHFFTIPGHSTLLSLLFLTHSVSYQYFVLFRRTVSLLSLTRRSIFCWIPRTESSSPPPLFLC
jgi:hypothetical protein